MKNLNLKKKRLRGYGCYRRDSFHLVLLICTVSQDPFSGPREGQVVLETDLYCTRVVNQDRRGKFPPGIPGSLKGHLIDLD